MIAFFVGRHATRSSPRGGEHDDDRQTARELPDQPELEEVLGHEVLEGAGDPQGNGVDEAVVAPDALLDDPLEPVERPAAGWNRMP